MDKADSLFPFRRRCGVVAAERGVVEEATDKAIAVLVEIAENKDVDAAVRFSAASLILGHAESERAA